MSELLPHQKPKSPIQFRTLTTQEHLDLTIQGKNSGDYVALETMGVSVDMLTIENRPAVATLPDGNGNQMQSLVFQISVPIPLKKEIVYGTGLITPTGINEQLAKAIPLSPKVKVLIEKVALIPLCHGFLPKEEEIAHD